MKILKKILTQHSAAILVLTFALCLRIPLLNGSFWLDEAAQALESIRPLSQQFDIIPDFQPPLLHLITHFASLVSHQEWWLRLIGAVIPGIVTIWAVYQIADKIFDRQTAIIASLLLSTNSFHIFFSQELRPYSLPCMFAGLSWLSLFRIKNHKHIKNWIPYIGLTLAGLYSSYLYPFLILSQIIYVFWQKKNWLKNFLISGAAVFLGYLPWLPAFFKQLATGQELRSQLPGWDEVVSLTQLKSLPLTYGKLIFGLIDIDINLFFVSAALVIALLSLFLFKQSKNKQKLTPIILWIFVPLITAWLVSFMVPVVRPKRVLFLLPAIYLFLAYLIKISLTKTSVRKTTGIALLLILFSFNLATTAQYWLKPHYQREDWQGLHQEIEQRFPEKQTVALFSFDKPFPSWRWYNQESIPSLATGEYYIKNVINLRDQLKPIFDYEFVLIFDYLRDLTDPEDELLQAVESYGFKKIGEMSRPNIGIVHIYSKTELVSVYLEN